MDYTAVVTKLLDRAVETVRRLPPDNQDRIARAMLRLAVDDEEPEPIDPAHLSDVLEGLAQLSRGEFATEEEIEQAFRRFDP